MCEFVRHFYCEFLSCGPERRIVRSHLLQINMVEKHATKIAVMGGKRDVQQMFAGIVGG